MSTELNSLKEQLVDLEIFMNSRAFAGYKAARREEIKTIEGRILLLRPDSISNIALINQTFGELDTTEEMEQIFEVTRVTLKARIDEMVEQENQDAQNTKV